MPTAFLSYCSSLRCRSCYSSRTDADTRTRKSRSLTFWLLMTRSLSTYSRSLASVCLRTHFEQLVGDQALTTKFIFNHLAHAAFLDTSWTNSMVLALKTECCADTPYLLWSWLNFQCVVDDPSLLPSTYGSRSKNIAFQWNLDHTVPQSIASLDMRLCLFIYLIPALCPLMRVHNAQKSDNIVPGKMFFQVIKFSAAVLFWIILSVRPMADLFALVTEESIVLALKALERSPLLLTASNSASTSASFTPSFFPQSISLAARESLHCSEQIVELVTPYKPTGQLTHDDIQFISDLGLPINWASDHWNEQRCVAFVGPVQMALAAAFAETIASSETCLSESSRFILSIPEVLLDDCASIAHLISSSPPCSSLKKVLEEVSYPLYHILCELLDLLDVSLHKWIPEALVRLKSFVGATRVDRGTKDFLLRLKPFIQSQLVPRAPELNSRLRSRLSGML